MPAGSPDCTSRGGAGGRVLTADPIRRPGSRGGLQTVTDQYDAAQLWALRESSHTADDLARAAENAFKRNELGAGRRWTQTSR